MRCTVCHQGGKDTCSEAPTGRVTEHSLSNTISQLKHIRSRRNPPIKTETLTHMRHSTAVITHKERLSALQSYSGMLLQNEELLHDYGLA